MFYLKLEPVNTDIYQTVYRVMRGVYREQAEATFRRFYQPFKVVKATYATVSLFYSASGQIEDEKLVTKLAISMPDDETILAVHERFPAQHDHPLLKIVKHFSIPTDLIEELRPFIKQKRFSFPNGSNYTQEILPEELKLPRGKVEIIHGQGLVVRVIGKTSIDEYYGDGNYTYGSGTNFGASFSTQDKYLKAFR